MPSRTQSRKQTEKRARAKTKVVRLKGILVHPGAKRSRKKKSVRWAVRSKLVRYSNS